MKYLQMITRLHAVTFQKTVTFEYDNFMRFEDVVVVICQYYGLWECPTMKTGG